MPTAHDSPHRQRPALPAGSHVSNSRPNADIVAGSRRPNNRQRAGGTTSTSARATGASARTGKNTEPIAILQMCEPDVLPPRRRLAHCPSRVTQLELPFVAHSATQLSNLAAPTSADAHRQQLCARLLLLASQTALGLRPVTQAIRWTTRGVYEELQRKHLRATAIQRTSGSTPGSFTLVGVRAQQVSDRVLECCGTVVTRGRTGHFSYRAVAARVVEHDGGWWVTHLEM